MFATQRSKLSFGRGIVRPYHNFSATACSKVSEKDRDRSSPPVPAPVRSPVVKFPF
jgi:hypothetical protein